MRKSIAVVFVCLLLAVSFGHADQFQGGFSQQYVTSAMTLPMRTSTYVLHTRGSTVSINDQAWSNATIAFSYNYGFLQNTELELSGVLYQDLNLSSVPGDDGDVQTANTPGRLYLRWKYAGKSFGATNFFWGLQGTMMTRLSSQAVENVYLEPYHSDNLGIQFGPIFSYFQNPSSINDGFQITYNFNYINFNNTGQFSSSMEALQVFSGLVIPINPTFTAAVESQGMYVMDYGKSWSNVYSIEAYAYLTPSIRYNIMPGVTLMSGVDIKVFENDELTDSELQPGDAPSYPGWRVTSKLVFTSEAVGGPAYQTAPMPGMQTGGYGGGYSGPTGASLMGQLHSENRDALYDWGGSVSEDVEYVEHKLEQIREDRIKAENKLREIREDLQRGK